MVRVIGWSVWYCARSQPDPVHNMRVGEVAASCVKVNEPIIARGSWLRTPGRVFHMMHPALLTQDLLSLPHITDSSRTAAYTCLLCGVCVHRVTPACLVSLSTLDPISLPHIPLNTDFLHQHSNATSGYGPVAWQLSSACMQELHSRFSDPSQAIRSNLVPTPGRGAGWASQPGNYGLPASQ